MLAVTCREFGEPETLRIEEMPAQPPGNGEVRIAVKAAGVNFPDYLMVTGKYQVKPPFPFIPGLEAAGEVIECAPDVEGLAPGRRVLATARGGGCFASELTIAAARVVPIPDGMGFVAAAAFPVIYGTAHFALTHRGALKPGETLLVTGAAGGVGLAAVEIGKRLGARVIAAARGAERLAIAKSRGADELIDYTVESLKERVKALTEGKGVDVLFDPVGGDLFDDCVRSMGWEGRLLVIGFASGTIPRVPTNLILVKNFSVIGVVHGAQTERDPWSTNRRLRELLAWHAEGGLKPLIQQTYRLDEAALALRQLAARQVTGKLVLTL
jgi:NADPH:quinone reductase